MDVATAYDPSAIFGAPQRGDRPLPRVFVSPQRYVQGPGAFRDLGRLLALVPGRRTALLMSQRGHRQEGKQLVESLRSAGIGIVVREFGGECSAEEISQHARALEREDIDCVVAAGGGKCIDAGKAIAFRLTCPIVIAPTLASNDAPCSAVSILYSEAGVSTGVESYPSNPAIVLVDTEIIAHAPERYLVAGIGDAMATWYEARVCMTNPAAVTTVGARPTLASAAIGEACARTLFEQGEAAAAAVLAQTVNDSLEAIVEANTLLSGLGFESGGLAAAHGVAQSYTQIPVVESNYLHGELVAMGTLVQLVLESRVEEATRVARFFASVGLPIHLGQLSLSHSDEASIDQVAAGTLEFPFIGNMPAPLTHAAIRAALLEADALGRSVSDRAGDETYRRLQDG